MKVNLDTNKNNQSFTAFKLCSGAEYTLKRVLKPKDWQALNDIIDSQAWNSVDIYLFGSNNGKFSANIASNNKYIKDKHITQWPFFESAVSFFKRLAKKADAIEAKINEMPSIDAEKIIQKIEK